MTNIDIVKAILRHIGDDPAQDKALAQGCLIILEKAAEATKPAAKPKKAAKDPEKSKARQYDSGRMRALYTGGWSPAMIADDMGVTEQTVRNHLKKEGLKK